jgi:hypothetical protein
MFGSDFRTIFKLLYAKIIQNKNKKNHSQKYLSGHNWWSLFSLAVYLLLNLGNVECDVCKRSFDRGDNLKRHKKTCTGINNPLCDQCGKIFIEMRYLKNHKKVCGIPKIKRAVNCIICGKIFKEKKGMNHHTKKACEKYLKMWILHVLFTSHLCCVWGSSLSFLWIFCQY